MDSRTALARNPRGNRRSYRTFPLGWAFWPDPAALTFVRSGADLIVRFRGLTDQITITDRFVAGSGADGAGCVERLEFADGTVVDLTRRTLALEVAGTASADTLAGYGGNDTLDGGAGNDTVYAGSGNDLILFNGGQDTVYGEGGSDVLDLAAGYSASSVYFVRAGSNLVVRFRTGSDSITIANRFDGAGDGSDLSAENGYGEGATTR